MGMSICDDDARRSAYLPNQAGDGGANPTSSLSFRICPIAHVVAKTFIETWHYSHRIPTGKNISFGLYTGDQLYAVIVYGIGVNPYQASFLGVKRVIEIKRMARSEPRLDYPLSRFISLSARFVAKEFPYDCIVAFADPEQGHEGTVYKASGFTLHGMTDAAIHLVDAEGNIRHRRYAYRHARRHGIFIEESRKILGVTPIKTLPKYRWVRYSGNKK